MAHEYLINNREPRRMYHFFEEISAIPRVSGHEARIAAYIVQFAKEKGFACYEDDIHNVLVTKPASRGCEHMPSILLEGHMDIYAAKTEDSTHDFDQDPIHLVVDGDILKADRTTLGADNGCAVALMLELLADDTLVHPQLECLFTVQEEVGLVGAKHFDVNRIKSRTAIGLDAGSDGVFRKGTSTKYEMTSSFATKREKTTGSVFRLTVKGLKGGDQGAGVPKERICAVKMTARTLHMLSKAMDIRLISIDKIGKSIPEDCTSYFSLVNGSQMRMQEILREQQALIRAEYAESDPGISIAAGPATAQLDMLSKTCSDNLITALYLLPYGSRNRSLARLDESMCSVITKKIYTDAAAVGLFTVVSAEKRIHGDALSEEMQTFIERFGFNIEKLVVAPGWDADEHSRIRDVMANAYFQLFGVQPKINISHGGNDCVVFKHKIPELDVVTTAATYVDFHTPREHLYMETFDKLYALIVRTLKDFCQTAEIPE